MAAYADYDYYHTEFGGTAVPQADFPAYAARASRRVDAVTLRRTAALDNIPNAVKDAVCAVADVLYKADQDAAVKAAVGRKAGETVGGYSVTYQSNEGYYSQRESDTQRLAAETLLAARMHLAPTGLLYMGMGC